jgi:hypothetical protein
MRPHLAAYPARDGTVPTLQWIGLGEGINDLRWLATVEAFIAAALEKGSPEARRRADDASAHLRTLAGRIDLDGLEVLSSRTSLPWGDRGASMLEEVRRELIRDARELHEATSHG